MPTQNRLHIVEKQDRFIRIQEGEYDSGFWLVAEKTADKLVGGLILFHKERNKPSYFGGRILSYRIQDGGENDDRIIFRFRYEDECRGIPAEGGWKASGMKLVMKGY
jgi:hypothetical protein